MSTKSSGSLCCEINDSSSCSCFPPHAACFPLISIHSCTVVQSHRLRITAKLLNLPPTHCNGNAFCSRYWQQTRIKIDNNSTDKIIGHKQSHHATMPPSWSLSESFLVFTLDIQALKTTSEFKSQTRIETLQTLQTGAEFTAPQSSAGLEVTISFTHACRDALKCFFLGAFQCLRTLLTWKPSSLWCRSNFYEKWEAMTSVQLYLNYVCLQLICTWLVYLSKCNSIIIMIWIINTQDTHTSNLSRCSVEKKYYTICSAKLKSSFYCTE